LDRCRCSTGGHQKSDWPEKQSGTAETKASAWLTRGEGAICLDEEEREANTSDSACEGPENNDVDLDDLKTRASTVPEVEKTTITVWGCEAMTEKVVSGQRDQIQSQQTR
jgi:hypothetical protein